MDLLSLWKPVFDLQPQYNTRTNNILCLKENVIIVPTDCTQKVHQRACLANCTEQLDPDFSLARAIADKFIPQIGGSNSSGTSFYEIIAPVF